MSRTSRNLGSIIELNPISQQHQINIPSASHTQSPRPLPLNLPRADLLVGSREEYLEVGFPLYEASIKGDWKAAKAIFDRRRELVRFSINKNCETALHVAASRKNTEFVENLVSLMEKKDLELQNNSSNTALCLAAAAGNVNMAKIMVKKNKALLDLPGSQGMTPLYMAALFGKHDMVKYLYDNSQKMNGDFWTDESRGSIFLKCVEADLFDVALQIVKDRPELAVSGRSVLGVLARKPHAFEGEPSVFGIIGTMFFRGYFEENRVDEGNQALQLLRIIWTNIVKLPEAEIDDILTGPADQLKEDEKPTSFEKEGQEAVQLLRIISQNIAEMHVKSYSPIRGPADLIKDQKATTSKVEKPKDAKRKYSSRLLFVAAEMGNSAFISELIRRYPELVQEVNENNQSIFHVAVSHRHKRIYRILYEIGSVKDSIITLEDENGNNMLHLVGILGESAKNQLQQVSGVVLQMQQELLWFQEVAAILPPPFRQKKNAAGLTPHEVFSVNHKDLVSKGEKWMKGIAAQLMVVATLVATISFAAAITFAGGYNQDTGNPVFKGDNYFTYFLVTDAISFAFASTSILIVLSILTSPYAELEFLQAIPRKLLLSLATLFVSITTMILTFIMNFFLLYRNRSQMIPTLISILLLLPYVLFYTILYPLLLSILHSTYNRRF